MEEEKTYLISFQFRMPMSADYDSDMILKLLRCPKLQETYQKDEINYFFK